VHGLSKPSTPSIFASEFCFYKSNPTTLEDFRPEILIPMPNIYVHRRDRARDLGNAQDLVSPSAV